MKKLFFILSFFLVAGMTANAQTCSKSKKACAKTCASKAKTASADAETTSVAAAFMEADEAAKANDSIEKRVCAKSGNVSYYEKAVCAKSGKVSYEEVKYCTDSKKFVNQSPKDGKVMSASAIKTSADAKAEKKACAKKCSKAEKAACSKMSKKECAKKCAAKKTGV